VCIGVLTIADGLVAWPLVTFPGDVNDSHSASFLTVYFYGTRAISFDSS
jgi:hypothetical protein